MRECDIRIVILRINKVMPVCDNYVTIHLPFAPSIKSNNKYLPT